jgi:hypothetical protein
MSHVKLPLGESDDLAVRIQRVSDFWRDLYDGGDPGGASWEELDWLHHEVVDCLARHPQEVTRAENKTAEAMLIMSNCEFL